MAFLCPVRIRRGKKKKSLSGDLDKDVRGGSAAMGRITGSSSIETLVRVGIEKENGLSPDSKMVVLHDFTPCVDDELQVKRGQVVNVLYRENDWVYVIAADNRQEGFIPHSYCTPYNSHLAELALSNVKKKLPREQHNSTDVEVDINPDPRATGDVSDCDSYGKKAANSSNPQQHNMTSSQASLHSASSSQPDVHPFFKDPSGRFIVLYTFIARDENDVSVERGEFVTVLNREDPDWYWIVRSDNQEGFVPSGFVYPADVIQGHLNQMNSNNNQVLSGNPTNHTATSCVVNNASHHLGTAPNEDLRYHGTELVMLYDYKYESMKKELGALLTGGQHCVHNVQLQLRAHPIFHWPFFQISPQLPKFQAQAPDDLSVRRGDWIYADLANQTVDGWLWAYAPKTRKYGFIPKAYARPPAMTSL